MPSTIPISLLEADNGNGTTTPLPGVTIIISDATTFADVATAVTDADGYIPATAVPGAAGTSYRLRCENYQGRAGSMLRDSV